MFKRLHPLFDESGDLGAASESISVESTETAAVQTQETETVETTDISKSASFAKRLSEEKVKWDKETTEKYKDAELHKELAEYLSELNGGTDLLTLKERRELERLEERAEKENVSPETLKRIDELEAKAAKGDKLEQEQQESQRVATFHATLAKFVEGKGVEPGALSQFMVDNELQYNPNNIEKSLSIALKAFQADDATTKLATAKEDAVKEYLASKKAPRVEGAPGSASVQAVDTRKMSTEQLNKHVLERFKAMNTPE